MLKKLRYEIIILAVLFLNVLVSNYFDLVFFKYFSYFDKIFQQTYLKKNFENITVLGDSLWYFGICFILMSIFFLLNRLGFFNKKNNLFNKIKYYNFLLFLSVLLSGLLTQLLKHIVGRPRPNTAVLETEYNLNFFTTDSHFHSFPSGHASTIFAVIIVLSLMVPKLKYFFYFIATLVSFSRVVVGAHFLTDIIGGGAVAFIGFKFSKLVLNKFFKIKNNENLFFFNNSFVLILIFMSTLSIILSIAPTFDIFFSSFFYFGENQFLMQSYYFITIFFRKIVLGFILIYILIVPFISILFPLHQLYFGYHFKKQNILYIWFSLIFVLVLIINLILKNMWGRARPNEILELGGKDHFTPWYQISNQCLSNCSFVSGDAAVGFSLVIFYFIIKKEAYLWLSLFFGSIIGLIRIMEGGHYLSDVVFSGLIVFLANIILYSYYLKKFNG